MERKSGIIGNMGQPMPDVPIEYGDDCLAGWPPSETPKYVYARFSKIEKCPDPMLIPPNDQVFKLTQDEFNPCDWFYQGSVWRVEFQVAADPDFVWLWLMDPETNIPYFEETPAGPPIEGHVFHNEIIACDAFHGGKNGIAVVTWTPQATDILKLINMEKAADLFMELRPREDGKLVYKFCRLQDATNIKILFEP